MENKTIVRFVKGKRYHEGDLHHRIAADLMSFDQEKEFLMAPATAPYKVCVKTFSVEVTVKLIEDEES